MHYPRTIAYGCTSSYRFKTIWSNQLGVLSSLSFIVSALNQSLAVRTSSHTTVNCPMSHQQGTNVVSLFDWVFSSFVLLSFHLHSFPSILWALQGRLNGETSAMICVPTFWRNCECTSMMHYVHLILSETMFASQIAFSLWFFVTQLAAQVSHLQAPISGQLSAVSKFLGHKPWYLDLSHPFILPCCGDTIWQLQASIWKVLESAIVMMQHRSVWSHLKLLFFSENHKGNPCGDVCMNWTIQQKFWTNLQFNTRPSKFW